MGTCTNCNDSFAKQFQGLLHDVCDLKQGVVSGADHFVQISPTDPTSSYLIDKLSSTSGITLTELLSGPSGHNLQIALDLAFLDGRYEGFSNQAFSFEINAGIHNANVAFDRLLGGIGALTYKNNKTASSSWNHIIPNGISPGASVLEWQWTVADSVSGICLFNVEYNSVSSGSILSLPYSQIVSGVSDGTALKVFQNQLDLVSGLLGPDEQFTLKFSRLGTLPQDSIEADIKILGLKLIYTDV